MASMASTGTANEASIASTGTANEASRLQPWPVGYSRGQ